MFPFSTRAFPVFPLRALFHCALAALLFATTMDFAHARPSLSALLQGRAKRSLEQFPTLINDLPQGRVKRQDGEAPALSGGDDEEVAEPGADEEGDKDEAPDGEMEGGDDEGGDNEGDVEPDEGAGGGAGPDEDGGGAAGGHEHHGGGRPHHFGGGGGNTNDFRISQNLHEGHGVISINNEN